MGINKDILRLSMPAIVSNITVPLLGLCDTTISGHLGSEVFLAAISVGSMMLNVIFWLFGFLRMGTTGLTANAFGAGDGLAMRKIFTRALFLGFSAGMLLIVFQSPLLAGLERLVGAGEDVEPLVGRYFSICIWEAPAMLATMAISGWFVGMQTTFYPMLIAVGVNVINIVSSLALVYGFGMGFEGIAYGTLTANWAGFVMALIAAFRFSKGERLFSSLKDLLHVGGLAHFWAMNVSLFLRSACITAVTLGVTSAGARMGAQTLAVNAVMMQFFTFFSFFMDGFAFSAEALVGKAAGSRDIRTLRRSVRGVLVWGLCVSLLFTLAYLSGYGAVADLLTDVEGVRSGVKSMWVWICLIPVVSVWAFVYDGFYVGITDTGKMMWATLAATSVFFAVAFFHVGNGSILPGVRSNETLWGAFLCYLLIRGVVLAALWSEASRKVIYGLKI